MMDAMLEGLRMESMYQGQLNYLLHMSDMCDPEEEETFEESLRGIVGDNSGKEIDAKLVQEARKEEMAGFKKHQVYNYVLKSEAKSDPDGKFIGARLVDINKGTEEKPTIRSRLVGQEFKQKDKRFDLYAPTPPLMSARYLVSRCASQGVKGGRKNRLMLIDVKKAFLYGRIHRNVYVELPQEDEMSRSGLYVGKLDKAMYGTRDAPAVWQLELESTLCELGFKSCITTPCLYVQKKTDLRIIAHADDLLCEGSRKDLETFLGDISKKYEVKSTVIGPDEDEEKEAVFLGRRIQWKQSGLSWTGDREIVDGLLRQWNMQNGSGFETPGVTDHGVSVKEVEVPMEKEDAIMYRSGAAKLNYASLDNPKIAYAAKEFRDQWRTL
jgi:hypothetical protein